MIGRRPFLKAALLAGAAVVGTPLLAACFRNQEDSFGRRDWDPSSIPGLDLHFDFTKLNQFPVDSTNFTAAQSVEAGDASVRGRAWTVTGDTTRTPGGLKMVRGREATTMIDADALPGTLIRASVTTGRDAASLSLVLRGNDSREYEVALRASGDTSSAELRGLPKLTSSIRGQPSNIALDSLNIIVVRLDAKLLRVLVNHQEVVVADLPGDWRPLSYGVGFRDGDTESALRDFAVFEYKNVVLGAGDRIAEVAQLVQPSSCLTAQQTAGTKMPTLSDPSIGDQRVLAFDGQSQSLVTNAAAHSSSVTILAVVKRSDTGKGTIVGPNGSDGGLQIRIDDDGSVTVLNAGLEGICRSAPGAVLGDPAIVAFSMDSVGNAQLYVNGRPAGAAHTQVQFPAGATLAIGSAYNSEFFSGDIAEILRWFRPLSGAELRNAFEKLSTKWNIEVANALDGTVPNPLGARGLKGSNIIPPLVDLEHDDPRASAWLNLWSRWDWAFIELSVRRAVEQGANTIRLIGDVNAVYTKAIDEATYHARLQQVVSLCASLNCRFYYCAIDLRHKRDAPTEFITTFLNGVAKVLARNSNVVAIELCNEVSSGYSLYSEDDVVSWISLWGKAIREGAPQMPLSISDVAPGKLTDKISGVDYYGRYASVVDFFDLHVYDDLIVGPDSQLLAPYQLTVNRPLLIGEFGADRSVADAQPAAFYSAVKTLRDSSPVVAGALQWGAINDDFGLYSETGGTLEPDIAAEWATF